MEHRLFLLVIYLKIFLPKLGYMGYVLFIMLLHL